MIAVIDNYDSFTYNLVQYLGELGADLQVFRNDQITLDELAALQPEKIVISPGPGDPNDGGISNAAIRRFSGEIPILGVCLGHQCIGATFGGVVKRAPQVDARQDLADLSQRAGHFRWDAQPLRGDALSLADGGRAGGGLPGNHGVYERRRGDGREAQRASHLRRAVPSRIDFDEAREAVAEEFLVDQELR